MMKAARSTTILCVRRGGSVALGGDGQVTLGNVVAKSDATKIRKVGGGKVTHMQDPVYWQAPWVVTRRCNFQITSTSDPAWEKAAVKWVASTNGHE